ncbi:MAG: GAF domain-containing protein [Pyrinomonadaceae bacterium]
MAKRRLAVSTVSEPAYDKELISTLLEITAEYKFDKILRLVVDKIPPLFHAGGASLFWLDHTGEYIVMRDTYPENRHNIGKRRYKIGEGLTGWVAKTGRPLRIKNIEDTEELGKIDIKLTWKDKYRGFRAAGKEKQTHQRAFLAVPIKIKGMTVGVLRIAKTLEPNREYSEHNENLLVSIADHLSAILMKAELLQRAEAFDELIEPILLKSLSDLDAYLQLAANVIPTILNSNGCSIFLKDEEIDSYVLKYTSQDNPFKEQIGREQYKKGEGLTGWVLLTGQSIRINDISNEAEVKRKYPGIDWHARHKEFNFYFMAAPIKTYQGMYGAIRLYKYKKAESIPFTEEDEHLLSKYGNFLGVTLNSLPLGEHGTILVRPNWEGRFPPSKSTCYVLMPFSKDWSKNIKGMIKKAVESNGLEFQIANQQTGRIVMKDIWRGICEARIVVADLSTANPNVTYEVGMSDVLGKELILLAQDPANIPFDFAGARLLLYNLNELDELETNLSERIAQIINKKRL